MAINLLEVMDVVVPDLLLHKELMKLFLTVERGFVDIYEYSQLKDELYLVLPGCKLLGELPEPMFKEFHFLLEYMKRVATNMKAEPGFMWPTKGDPSFAQVAQRLEVAEHDFTHWLLKRCRVWFINLDADGNSKKKEKT